MDNIDISDIDFNEKEGKHILDSSDKIIRWIKHRINEQESKKMRLFQIIDISIYPIALLAHTFIMVSRQ